MFTSKGSCKGYCVLKYDWIGFKVLLVRLQFVLHVFHQTKHVLCLVYFLKKSYFSFLKIKKKTSDLAIPTESITSLILKNIVNYFNTELDFIHLLDIG